jgi:hypothetical protein
VSSDPAASAAKCYGVAAVSSRWGKQSLSRRDRVRRVLGNCTDSDTVSRRNRVRRVLGNCTDSDTISRSLRFCSPRGCYGKGGPNVMNRNQLPESNCQCYCCNVPSGDKRIIELSVGTSDSRAISR